MKLCIPFNFGEGTDSLRYAFRAYGDTTNVEIHAVHFTQTSHETVDNVIRNELLDMLEEETGSDQQLDPEQVRCEIEVVDGTDRKTISEAIEEYVRAHDVDQIIMSEQDRSVLSKMYDKSNLERVIESEVAPVTVVD